MQIFAVTRGWGDLTHDRLAAAVAAAARVHPGLDPSTLESSAHAGDVCIAAVAHGPAAAAPRVYRAVRGRALVLYDGRPVDRQGELAAHDAGVLAERWADLPGRLEGVFAAVRLDTVTGEAECLLDALGMAQVYLARRGAGWALSNSVEVLRHVTGGGEPDGLGVASMLTLGWVAGDRTLLRGIEVLPGGHVHRLADRHVARPLFTPATVVPRRAAPPAPPAELAATLVRVTAAAAEGIRPLPCGLTAGRDSRVVLALARAAGLPVECFTSTVTSERDVRVAADLAGRLGLPHGVLTPDVPGSSADWVRRTSAFAGQTDGMASLWGIADWAETEALGPRLGLRLWGAGGEIGRSGMVGVGTPVTANAPGLRRSWRAQRLVLEAKTARWDGLVTSAAADETRRYLDGYVARRREEGWRPSEVLESYYAFERVRRWAAAGVRRARGAVDTFSPFVTRPFVEYCYALSPGERYVEAAHHRLLSVLGADLRDAPFDRPWRPQRARGAWTHALTAAASRVLRRPHGPADPVPFGARWYEAGLPLHRDLCLSHADSRLWELVDRRRFESLSADARGPGAEGLCRVLTLFWYFHGRHDAGAA